MVEKNDENLINWPENGKIKFENYSTKYRPDTDIVLKKINFNVNSQEKIGIVGRTGSGKSTITLSLFRILEPIEGIISIDDIDITTIGLKKLRSNITIIPQDPAIFSGTLRYNIDPLNLVTDDEIKNVMNKINFNYIINKHPNGLYQDIAEGGSNLSVGEKQLICICRAILRKSKIIIMDEATASIDFQTEEIIQKAINEIMKNSTVLTIAHRIKTIIKYDKILVLDNGEVKDFDSPEILKKKKDGIFYELYQKSGG
jgi:ABC-type multidrug transport system fused ATPase/permease subunit